MPAPASLVLASRNPHKLREFARLLASSKLSVLPLAAGIELPPETGSSFEDNALPKARAAAAATGLASIADDSGIEAEALGGRPGVRSARYAGLKASDEQNLDRLLREAPAGSPLRYVCALALVDPEGEKEQVFFGYCSGRLAAQVIGSGGFGYDPAFVPAGHHGGRTMAQLSDEEKDGISHRGAAVRALLDWLRVAPKDSRVD